MKETSLNLQKEGALRMFRVICLKTDRMWLLIPRPTPPADQDALKPERSQTAATR